jgi:hypothetical protein
MYSRRLVYVTHVYGDCSGPNTSCQGIDRLGSPLYICHLPVFPIMLTDATSFKCAAVCSDLLDCLEQVLGKDVQLWQSKHLKQDSSFFIILLVYLNCVDWEKFWAPMPFRPLISYVSGAFGMGCSFLYSGDLVKESCSFQKLLLCFKFYFLLSNITSARAALQTQCTLFFFNIRKLFS